MADLRLGAFRLVRPIAEGGMAVVWGGLHVGSDLPVAVKILTGGDVRDPMVRTAFRNEVRAVARLNHPGIIAVLDFGEVDATAAAASEGRLQEAMPYLVMEYAGGGALGKRKRRWSWTAVRRLLLALLDALAHAHSRGVVHRDLKPGNILLSGPGDVRGGIKLTDFGIAWVGGAQGHTMAGTLQYMAPEQHTGDWVSYGPWTDLYAVGCVAWRIVAGHTPFAHVPGKAVARAHLFERPPVLIPRFPVPDGLDGWLRTLLHKDPGARFACAADAVAALEALPVLDDDTEAEDLGDAEDDEAAYSDASSESPVPVPLGAGENVSHEDPPEVVAVLPEDWSREPSRVPMRLQGAGLGLFSLREIPMFGREKQRELLWRGLRGVAEDGAPRAVLLQGPSGVGKTRLVEWLVRRAHELGGIPTLSIRGERTAEAVAEHLGVERLEGPERSEQVAERLKRIPGAEDLGPALLAGLTPGGRFDVAGWRGAVRRLLEVRSIERPALLVLDDAHEAEEALELAREVAAPPGPGERRAVLVVLVARDDDGLAERPEQESRIAAILEAARAKAVRLGPLEDHARRELLEHLGLSGPLAARVDERSGGNPQYAIQLVGDWVQRGLLQVGSDGLELRPGADAPVPDDLHQVWAARINRLLQALPVVAAIHLERAAALGMQVDDHEWDRACDDPASGRVSDAGLKIRGQLVERLLDARLVEERPRGWVFAHPMLRESLERTSRKAKRWAGHHQAIAQMLEASPNAEAVRIGLHRLEAGDAAAAVDLLLEGISTVSRSGGLGRMAAALLPLERAMRQAPLAEDDPRWAALWRMQASVLRQRGRPADALRVAEHARDHVDRDGAEAEWARCTHEAARCVQDLGDLPEALRLLQKAVARLLRAGIRGRDLARLLTLMCSLGRMMNELDDAERWATQAVAALARAEEPDPGLEGIALGELAVVAARRKESDRALELFEQAEALLRQADLLGALANVVNNRGDVLKNIGRWQDAEEAFLTAAEIEESNGTMPEIPRLNLALTRIHAGRYAEGAEAAAEVARHAHGVNGAIAQLSRAVCDAATGDVASATRSFGPAVEVLRNARFVDPDLCWLSEHGASRAEEHGAVDLACLFWFLAREQSAALGDEDGVARATLALEDLDEGRYGAPTQET